MIASTLATVLAEIPMSGTYPEVEFDARGECTWVKFFDAHEPWVGVFGRGVAGPELVCQFGEIKAAFVIARGQGYIVDLLERKLIESTASPTLQDAATVSATNYVVTADWNEVYLFDSKGEIWRSIRLARDGIELVRTSPLVIEGRAEQHDGWHNFSIDVATGKLME